jgi:hypothetical protein
MIALYIFLFGLGLGVLFGLGEGETWRERIRTNHPEGLPHAKLLALRIAVCVLVGGLAMPLQQMDNADTGQYQSVLHIILRTAGICFMGLTAAHRIAFNLHTHRPWYYMGDETHKPGDSIYDTIIWFLAGFAHTLLLWRLRPWHDVYVWLTAFIIEASTLALLLHW